MDAARENGLRAARVSSAQSGATDCCLQVLSRELDLLYVAPERLATDPFLNALKRSRLSLIAIDEAHCISEWGNDFRPDYLCAFQSEGTLSPHHDCGIHRNGHRRGGTGHASGSSGSTNLFRSALPLTVRTFCTGWCRGPTSTPSF